MHADRYNSAKNGRANQSRLKSQLRKKATRNTRMVSNVRYVESQGQFGTIPLHSSVNSRNNRCLLVRTGKKEGVDSSTLLHSTPTLNEALWLRKLRNRLSQRAFRLRQAKKIKDLHERVETSQSQDVNQERFLALQQENERLRKHIELLQAQIGNIQASLKAMSQSTSRILESEISPELVSIAPNTQGHEQSSERNVSLHFAPDVTRDERGVPVAESDDVDEVVGFQSDGALNAGPSRPGHEPNVTGNTLTNLVSDWPLFFTSGDQDSMGNVQTTIPTVARSHGCDPENTHLDPSLFLGPQNQGNSDCEELQSIPPGIPNVWNFDYQMGSDSYANAIDAVRPSAARLGWMQSNSPISDHIRILKSFLSVKFGPSDVSLSVCRT
jgi:hypothetical protein